MKDSWTDKDQKDSATGSAGGIALIIRQTLQKWESQKPGRGHMGLQTRRKQVIPTVKTAKTIILLPASLLSFLFIVNNTPC